MFLSNSNTVGATESKYDSDLDNKAENFIDSQLIILPAYNYNKATLDDLDNDGVEHFEDNCPWIYNPQQYDDNFDGQGNACDDNNADDFDDETSDEDEDDQPSTPQCDDGIDNDGDGKIDYPADAGCTNRLDDSELPFENINA